MTAQQRHGDGDRNQGGDGAGCAIDSTVGPVREGSLQLVTLSTRLRDAAWLSALDSARINNIPVIA